MNNGLGKIRRFKKLTNYKFLLLKLSTVSRHIPNATIKYLLSSETNSTNSLSKVRGLCRPCIYSLDSNKKQGLSRMYKMHNKIRKSKFSSFYQEKTSMIIVEITYFFLCLVAISINVKVDLHLRELQINLKDILPLK